MVLKIFKNIFFKKFILLLFVFALKINLLLGQNLINLNEINNNGLLRVKQEALGLPLYINGTFELFGGDQVVPARKYNKLILIFQVVHIIYQLFYPKVFQAWLVNNSSQYNN